MYVYFKQSNEEGTFCDKVSGHSQKQEISLK